MNAKGNVRKICDFINKENANATTRKANYAPLFVYKSTIYQSYRDNYYYKMLHPRSCYIAAKVLGSYVKRY
jgi:hypothetical protein